MGAELGATTSVFGYDVRMARYLAATERAELVSLCDANSAVLQPDAAVVADPEAYYDEVVRIDLSTLEPHVVGPHSPDRARPISALAAEVADPDNGFVDAVSSALIGSCTNSSCEDMSRAADVAEQARAHGLAAAIPFLVTPGSERVRATVERDGQLAAFNAIDGTVLANACGPCIGQWRRGGPEKPNTILTSYNRNFPSRNDGRPETMNFIASPEIVTAFALAGRLSFNPLVDTLEDADGKEFRFAPPKPAPEAPEAGFVTGENRTPRRRRVDATSFSRSTRKASACSCSSRGTFGTAAISWRCRYSRKRRAKRQRTIFRPRDHGSCCAAISTVLATTC